MWNAQRYCNLLKFIYNVQVTVYVILGEELIHPRIETPLEAFNNGTVAVGIVSRIKTYALPFQVLLDSCINKFSAIVRLCNNWFSIYK